MKKIDNKTHAIDIYRGEYAFLEEARRTLDDPALSQDALRELYSVLITEYDVLLRKIIKMTMVGDTAQRKLRNANAYIKEQQRELEQKNAQLNQEIMERGQLIEDLEAFAHTVAHDLKNPLGVIIGYMDLVFETLNERHDTELLEMVESVNRTAKQMHRIITELFTFASVRQQEIIPTLLDMGMVVVEVETRLAHMLSAYQVELSKPATWPAALGYKPWIEEVWINYISNALKYGGTPPRVHLGFDLLPSEPQDVDAPACMPQIRFWVRDNGEGLSPENQARLFTKFTRFDQARATGHGLGLSIVKRIVEKLGGQVGVESIPGQGSLFFFTLPSIEEASPPTSTGHG
ncbi:MAG: HAMP domain-containing histidine kinase [Chloroflexaceae bacterium]|nr:HAMP domain-containing histidine kinase [Chloroflexaceae bacterium]